MIVGQIETDLTIQNQLGFKFKLRPMVLSENGYASGFFGSFSDGFP